MKQSRRSPFEGVTDFVSEMSRLRSRGLFGNQPGVESTERSHASAWVPPADIYADGDDLVIRIEVAGVSPDDVDLSLQGGLLSIGGTRPGHDDAQFYVRELFHGEFRRVISLPEGTEAEDVSATVENGLVELVVRGGTRHDARTAISMVERSPGARTQKVRKVSSD